MTRTLTLAEQLISCPTAAPDAADCLPLLAAHLQTLGFVCDPIDRINLWAKWPVSQQNQALAAIKTIAFSGHTKVLPTGSLAQWRSPPFMPTQRNGKLYGRGASGMKTSIAAFIVAVEEFLAATPEPLLNIALLLTGEEEGLPSERSTNAKQMVERLLERLKARGERLDYCIVGEPTAVKRTGDRIKNGRRGTLSGALTVRGVPGHIASPQLARNPIHEALPALVELSNTVWDPGDAFFQPTSWQMSNIHGGTGAGNAIPGDVSIDFNFRFSTASSAEGLKQRVHAVLDRHGLEYALQWTLGGQPFLSPSGELVAAVQQAIAAETGLTTELSTSGGTSDGRFIAALCPQVIECGPPHASTQQIDEHIAIADIEPLKNIYRRTLENLHAQALAAQA
ncbi:MAG: succinyl-diaminopimelate desuccinylase [Giesbergeria sp.]|nr:succinyl-diaminopimelate desuccinylase [Giesbergeria sp.]